MSKLEELDANSWEAFTQSPIAVLMLGKSDCPACAEWSAELEKFLGEDDQLAADVRFGKLFLDRGGLASFKRANPWVAELEVLPFTQIYTGGERAKSFAGGGIERLRSRLRSLRSASDATPQQ